MNVARLWMWELEALNIREWGLPTGTGLWRSWRTPRTLGGWFVFRYEPHADPGLVAIKRYRVELRHGPRPP